MQKWIGMVHVRDCSTEPKLNGAIGAFVSVIALANDSAHFIERAGDLMASMGFQVVEIEDIALWDKRAKMIHNCSKFHSLAAMLPSEGTITYGPFDSYEAE